jgi:hypothetical protein
MMVFFMLCSLGALRIQIGDVFLNHLSPRLQVTWRLSILLQATPTSLAIPATISFASLAQLILVKTSLPQFGAHVSTNRPLAGLPISAAISFAPLP